MTFYFFRATECLDHLVAKGADCNQRDSRLRTPLHYAASKCLYSCVRTAVAAGGCDVNCRDADGITPLMLLAEADVEASVIEYLLGNSAEVAVRDARGYHALHYAAASASRWKGCGS